MSRSTAPSVQNLPVIRSAEFTVTSGANLGDGLTDAGELMLDDIYGLRPRARRVQLTMTEAPRPATAPAPQVARFTVTETSEAGTPGQTVILDSALTFMCPDGSTVEALVFVEVTPEATVAETYLLPLAEIQPRRDYTLVAVDRDGARARLAQTACVSFARGTHITMSNGLQKRIETLVPGDRVLTRDNGVREIRWIGQQTVRATGAFAPIVIARGALNNSGDLMLSPNHRLFIYQRRDRVRAGRSEVLVRARQLVNGDSVVQSDGGFVDYFQLLFDQHEIIYAEGIAAESLLVDTRVRPVIPDEVRMRLDEAPAGGGFEAYEIDEGALDAAVAADLLRRASAC